MLYQHGDVLFKKVRGVPKEAEPKKLARGKKGRIIAAPVTCG